MASLPHETMNLPNGDRLGFVRVGGAEPGLLVVGGYGKSALEKPIGSIALQYALQRQRACIVLEFRSQGRSSPLAQGMSVPGMRDDILAAADTLGLRNCLGIGASLGAWALLAAQQQRNSLLWGMLALAPALDWDLTYFKPLSERGGLATHGNGQIHVPASGIVVSHDFFSGLDACRIRVDALRFKGPLHVIHGADDVVAPIARSEQFAAESGATLIRLAGAGHEVSALQSATAQQAFVIECDTMLAPRAAPAA
ncbi:MAG: hypothetical protein IPK59_17825 [Rhodospirillaceae bacterium]|nr:hypothetical protein [Rhodospirillaceae bacterium]